MCADCWPKKYEIQYWMQNYMERIETNYLKPDWLEIILTILGFIHTDWVGSFCLDKDRFLQTDWFLQWQFITDWCQVVWTRGGFLLKYWFDHVYGPISWLDSSKSWEFVNQKEGLKLQNCLLRRIKTPKFTNKEWVRIITNSKTMKQVRYAPNLEMFEVLRRIKPI